MKTIYNEDEKKYSEMIKDLQNLSKIETPENFEFNLMTRIKNKNFGTLENEKQNFSWIKFLAPSAVVVTAIILLFVFLPSSQQIDNPLIIPAQKVDSQPTLSDNSITSKNIHSSGKVSESVDNNLSSRNSKNPVNKNFPVFSARPGVSLDDFISGSRHERDMLRGNIVNGGNELTPNDGFFISEKPDQKTLNKYRAQVDSVRKAQSKADSAKKAQKLP